MELEPITRKEKIIAGQDLTPITRMEKFLKNFGGSGGGGSSVPKPLTYDYMPAGYPKKSVETITVLEEQELAFADEGGLYVVHIKGSFEITEGRTYTVNWDGTDYECVGSVFNEIPILGNTFIYGVGQDTGEPFLYLFEMNNYGSFLTSDTAASHTISVKTAEETVTPMAEEFLPAGGGASSADMFIIHATTDETFTNVQLDKTAEQIYEAYQSRKYCLVDLNGTFYPVTSVETNGSKYLMSGNGFAFPTSEQGSAVGFELATSDGVTWSVNRKTPYLYNVRFNGLQISGPGNQYYTISVDTNGNLTATVVT